MKKFSKIYAWVLAILWMALMFFLSSQPDLRSKFSPNLDFVLRKLAHVAEYFILTLLLFRALNRDLGKSKALTVAAGGAFLYAISDEWHQTFVYGRYGTYADVLIDSAGVLLGAFFAHKIYDRRKR
jgi:VanZ family protein